MEWKCHKFLKDVADNAGRLQVDSTSSGVSAAVAAVPPAAVIAEVPLAAADGDRDAADDADTRRPVKSDVSGCFRRL